MDDIFSSSVRSYKNGTAVFVGTLLNIFLSGFYLFPIFLQYLNNYFSFPWSFFPYFRDQFPPLCVCMPAVLFHAFPCRIPHLVLWSVIFVPSLSSSPACRHCPPSPEPFLFTGGGADEGEELLYPTLYQVTLP